MPRTHLIIASLTSPTGERIVRSRLTGRAVVRVMADDLLAHDAISSGVTDDDLKRVGWTPAQIAESRDAACLRAHERAVR